MAEDTFVPTDAMAAEARRGLEWRREFNRGGTAVGVARARDIANKKALSRDTIARMASFFARHEVDKKGTGFSPGEDGYPSAGRIAWALWGGDAGASWAKARWERIQASESEAPTDELVTLAKIYVPPHASISPDGKPFRVEGYWRGGSPKKIGDISKKSTPKVVNKPRKGGNLDALLKSASISKDKLDPAAVDAINRYMEANGPEATQTKLESFMKKFQTSRGKEKALAKRADESQKTLEGMSETVANIAKERDLGKRAEVSKENFDAMAETVRKVAKVRPESPDDLSPEGKAEWDAYLKSKSTEDTIISDDAEGMKILEAERAPLLKDAPTFTDAEKRAAVDNPEAADEVRGEVKKHKGKFGTMMKAVPGILKTSVAILRTKDDPEGVEKVPLKTKAKLGVALAIALNPLDEVLGPVGPAIMVTSLGMGMAMVADDIGLDRLKAEWKGTPDGWALVEKAMKQFAKAKAKIKDVADKILGDGPDTGAEARAPKPSSAPRFRMAPAMLSAPPNDA